MNSKQIRDFKEMIVSLFNNLDVPMEVKKYIVHELYLESCEAADKEVELITQKEAQNESN